MGYRSEVVLKTTTEGYLLFKKFNDSIKEPTDKPLAYMHIQKTESGFYKISHDYLKWYESYKDVENFMTMLNKLDDQEIPYKFIRIGEDYNDIEIRENYTEDMPEEIMDLNLEREIYDCSEGSYTDVSDE
ncbi:MAG: hypothetical protein K2P14_10400 [Anaeroplasmataceae bacterium]|nr:hypothetical protein [Anaeroplasmataceae bacterium]